MSPAPSRPPSRVASGAKRVTSGLTVVTYVETSALLAALLEQDRAAQHALRAAERRVTSALTFVEAQRAMRRARATARLSSDDEQRVERALATFAARCDIMSISEEVLIRAGQSFAVEPIRTLDAIHLATVAMLCDHPPLVVVLTRDARVRDNAQAMGFGVA